MNWNFQSFGETPSVACERRANCVGKVIQTFLQFREQLAAPSRPVSASRNWNFQQTRNSTRAGHIEIRGKQQAFLQQASQTVYQHKHFRSKNCSARENSTRNIESRLFEHFPQRFSGSITFPAYSSARLGSISSANFISARHSFDIRTEPS